MMPKEFQISLNAEEILFLERVMNLFPSMVSYGTTTSKIHSIYLASKSSDDVFGDQLAAIRAIMLDSDFANHPDSVIDSVATRVIVKLREWPQKERQDTV